MRLRLPTLAAAAALLASLAPAQTQTLRGKIEDVSGTANQFFLDCTQIPMTSAALNLNGLMGQQLVMQVQNTGTAQNPTLEVVSATPTTKVFDMGNLDIGDDATWEVFGTPGDFAFVFYGATSNTGYTPFAAPGTWLLGQDAQTLFSGFVTQMGSLQRKISVPDNQALVGLEFTGQALVLSGGTWSFSNPDCKTVRAN